METAKLIFMCVLGLFFVYAALIFTGKEPINFGYEEMSIVYDEGHEFVISDADTDYEQCCQRIPHELYKTCDYVLIFSAYRSALKSTFQLQRSSLMVELNKAQKDGLTDEMHMNQLIFHKHFPDHVGYFIAVEQCLAQGKRNVTNCCVANDVAVGCLEMCIAPANFAQGQKQQDEEETAFARRVHHHLLCGEYLADVAKCYRAA